MSNNIDFKALWDNGGRGPVPDASEIFKKGAQMQRTTRNKLLICNMMLTLTIILITWVWIHYQPQMITTKLGILLIIGAIVFYIMTSMGYINLLYKSNMEESATEYLQHLLAIKQKQERLNTTITTIYFALLSTGLFLYMIEYAGMMTVPYRILAYVITFAWMAFNWFYTHPRVIKKQRGKINTIIEKLEAVNGQMISPES